MLKDLLLTIFSGGMTGLFGSVITGILTFLREREKYKYQINIEEYKLKRIEKEYLLKKEIASIDAEKEMELAAQESFKKSIEADKASYTDSKSSILLVIVDFLRGIIRPSITIYSIILVTLIWFQFSKLNSFFDTLTNQQIYEMMYIILITILYLAVVCVTWWFGDRSFIKKLMGALPLKK